MPPYLSQLSLKYQFNIKETNTLWMTTDDFRNSNMSLGWKNLLKLEEIQNIQSFTLTLDMIFLDVYDRNGKNVINRKQKLTYTSMLR